MAMMTVKEVIVVFEFEGADVSSRHLAALSSLSVDIFQEMEQPHTYTETHEIKRREQWVH
jgi:hypothetical protein